MSDPFDVDPLEEPTEEDVLPPAPVEEVVAALDTPTNLAQSLPNVPRADPDEDTPPDDAVPPFRILRNKWGPGAHGVYLADGKPVGVWVNELGLTGAETRELLSEMGLDADLVEFFASNRDGSRAATAELLEMPGVQAFAAAEEQHTEQTAAMRQAFLDAHRRREKKE